MVLDDEGKGVLKHVSPEVDDTIQFSIEPLIVILYGF